MLAVGVPAISPLSIGQADDAPPVGNSICRVHQSRAPLVLQLRDLTQRLDCSHQPVQDAATLRVLAWVGWPDSCQSGHKLQDRRGNVNLQESSSEEDKMWQIIAVQKQF